MSLFTRNVIISLVITVVIIATIIFSINYLNEQRVAELNTIENQLSTDTLSLETQYSLLETAPCEDFVQGSTTQSTSLSAEVSDLGDKLAYAEDHLGSTDADVVQLKQQYTLLEIRDYLLTRQLSQTCHVNPTIVLYFYSNNCQDECDRAGYALSYMRQTYPSVRVYSFDYDLNLPALTTLEQLEKVQATFPAFVINGKTYYGFTTLDEFETYFPPSLFATSTATSTATTTKSAKK